MTSFGGVPELDEPWEIYQGDDRDLYMTFENNGEPVSLEDIEIRCAWRKNTSAEEQVELPIFFEDQTGATVPRSEGKIVIRVTGEKTASGEVGNGVFDVQVRKDGRTTTLLRGKIKVKPDVTK